MTPWSRPKMKMASKTDHMKPEIEEILEIEKRGDVKTLKPMNVFERLWLWVRGGRRVETVRDFAQNHRDFVVIVLDPKDDSLYASYRGQEVFNVIKSSDGRKQDIVKSCLSRSRFRTNIDRLISGLAQSLNLSVKDGNQLWHWLDAALHAISNALWRKKHGEKERRMVK